MRTTGKLTEEDRALLVALHRESLKMAATTLQILMLTKKEQVEEQQQCKWRFYNQKLENLFVAVKHFCRKFLDLPGDPPRTVEEALKECEKWKMSDEELKQLME